MTFTQSEIEFMRTLGLDFGYESLTDDQRIALEDTVASRLEFDGLDVDYQPTQIGRICERILAKLP